MRIIRRPGRAAMWRRDQQGRHTDWHWMPSFTFLYAGPNGGPVLIDDATWKDINGILISSRIGHTMIIFRRDER